MENASLAALDIRSAFLNGMTLTACTVNIVTTDGAAGRFGATVSSMSSVSADGERPTLLICMHHKVSAAPAIIENRYFCVNVLRDRQAMISDSFAGRVALPNGDKFASTRWKISNNGQPRIEDALVTFDCRLQSSLQVGTHFVFIGEVMDVEAAESGSPLIYSNRAYGTLGRLPESGSPVTANHRV
ncbi:flavin reductase family protein [Phyllobacterium chamaecytisi]|uniref:flavin reductase family protein n=1 Tax=Phyllobacterium chamaecytisi TaxID=2876082 RepID=UPI001CCC9BD7|nr:flavin reductase family protein [Phyllobacterium sp. KW56]MBZ9603601.1 flavin reductase family protein [Phyllobacterium sp. KW56]